MTARNLKIRITVGPEDTRQTRRASAAPRPIERATSPAPARSAATATGNSLPKWLLPSIAVAAVLAGLGYFLADSEDSAPPPHTRVDPQTAPAATSTEAAGAAQTATVAPRTPDRAPPAAAVTPRTEAPQPSGAVGAPAVAALAPAATAPRPEAPPRSDQAQTNEAAPAAGASNRSGSAAAPPAVTAAVTTPSAETHNTLPTSDNVARAIFAPAIARLEPTESLNGVLSPERGLSRLYFFTELRGLRGQRIRHRWLINGQRIADIPINVGSDRYRASSNMRLTPNRRGTWEVQVLDSQGKVLHVSRLEYR